jgi:hypothetical protein
MSKTLPRLPKEEKMDDKNEEIVKEISTLLLTLTGCTENSKDKSGFRAERWRLTPFYSIKNSVEKFPQLEYNSTMNDIDKINDKLFKDSLQKPENARTFLKTVLPDEVKKRIDFSIIEIGPTGYVSKDFKEYFSDIIIRTQIISKKEERLPTDVCFILEHKTKGKIRIFIQFLKYMVQEWQKDIDEKNPPAHYYSHRILSWENTLESTAVLCRSVRRGR